MAGKFAVFGLVRTELCGGVWQMCTLAGHTSDVVSVSFDPDGKRVVSGAEDNRVKIWDVAMLAEVCRERERVLC